MKPIIDTVTIKRDWVILAETLTVDERGIFYHAVCRYALFGETPILTGLLGTYFALIKRDIDISTRRKIASKKGLQTRLQNRFQNGNQTSFQNADQNADCSENKAEEKGKSASSGDQSFQNDFQTDFQNGFQTDIQNPTQEKKTKVSPIPPSKNKEKDISTPPVRICAKPDFFRLIPDELKTPAFVAAWKEWEVFRRKKRKPISEEGAKRQLSRLAKIGVEKAIQAIDDSIANDYQGLWMPKSVCAAPAAKKKDYSGI